MKGVIISIFIFLAVFNSPVFSEEELQSGDDKSINQALEELNKTLKELSNLISTHLKQQKLALERQQIEIVMRRIELHNIKLAPMEKQLRDLKADKAYAEEDIKRFQVEKERKESRVI